MQELERLLNEAWPGLSTEQSLRIQKFYEALSAENEVQNLTRLISPTDFVEGHVIDVRELLNSGLLSFPALDLGSGGGVPGLLAAAVTGNDTWTLCDSEKMKADFLFRASASLGLEKNVSVYAGRAEDFLRNRKVEAVVARAVGPVERIYGWIGRCSTWNTLVLLKGPGWEEEWKAFQEGKHARKLKIADEYRYEVGPEKKKRVIVRLKRVK